MTAMSSCSLQKACTHSLSSLRVTGTETRNQDLLSNLFFSYFPPPAEPVKVLRCNMVRGVLGGELMLSADEMGKWKWDDRMDMENGATAVLGD